MKKLFSSKTKELEVDIDRYLDRVEKSALLFNEGVKDYINDNMNRFDKHLKEITIIENEADNVRRDIKYKLYTFMLIPDSRGDVLGLIETTDNVIDTAKKVLEQLSIETPKIPDFLKADFLRLADFSCKAVEELVKGERAFFKEIQIVNDYINKIHFYEHEADKIEEQLERKVFKSKEITSFSRKMHIRYFIERIALLSDEAEEVSERLSVYAIKRFI